MAPVSDKDRAKAYRDRKRDGELGSSEEAILLAELAALRSELVALRSETVNLRAMIVTLDRDVRDAIRDAVGHHGAVYDQPGSLSTPLGNLGGVGGGSALGSRSPSGSPDLRKDSEKKPRFQDLEAESAGANGTDKSRDVTETYRDELSVTTGVTENVTMRITKPLVSRNGLRPPGGFSHAASSGLEVSQKLEEIRRARAEKEPPQANGSPLLAANLRLEDDTMSQDTFASERERQLAEASRWGE